ncbi:M16 family metallopeptidase [Serinibacter salmoneus]|uniref:Putative Zn-dependent peptidase n=1 Tax=Serinibacter salmoneus TaxID=556530 RepID=A0A2A9D0H7_9MICO|nr:pitrilysin family protein [Serinibacter salmoneus]PFG19340.1 putative Zn-dependent peptidase [Serinibacter salmoneus]
MPHDLPLDPAGSELEVNLPGGALLRRSVLPGGVRVLSETQPGTRSVSLSATLAVGSRDEHDGHHGSTHFLEHLLFKGTPRRSAREIAEAFDEVGGEANAATGKESTSYYARVLDADAAMAGDVLLDMVTSASLREEDTEMERGVILEELAAAEDDPADVVHEAFHAAVFDPHPLGRPIGGTPETIRQVPHEAVVEHYRRTYRSDELVVAAAGNVDHDALVAQVRAGIESSPWAAMPGARPERPAPRRTGARIPTAPAVARTVRRESEQAHLILGGRALSAGDERRFVLAVLSAALGGGMSSRLFQEVREQRGLAYTVYTFTSGYTESGLVGTYVGCSPARVAEVTQVVMQEWRDVAERGISPEELRRAVGQLRGSIVLGLEDPGSRMSRLVRSETSVGHYLSLEETFEQLRAVSVQRVRDLAADLLAEPTSLVVVGPYGHDVAGEVLADLHP